MSHTQHNNTDNHSAMALWPLRFVKGLFKLPTHIAKLYEVDAQSKEAETSLSNAVEQLNQTLSEQSAALLELSTQVAALDHRVSTVASRLNQVTEPIASGVTADSGTAGRFADNHSLDEFYVGFEDKFRGDEDAITSKVAIYPPLIKKTGIDFSKYPVVDIGCGRGELISALNNAGIRAIGLDINYEMVKRAHDSGLEAVQGDAIGYLQSLEPESVSAITAMHLAEHLPFPELLTLFQECYRVLVPGGKAIFETPNPENLMVGIYSFYMDPSHLHPLPPPLTEFALQSAGFGKTEVMRLHDARTELPKYDDELMNDLAYRMYGALDYAAIGTKNAVKKPAKKAKTTRK